MKKNKKNNETKKIIVISLAIALIIILVGGATFAYWSWQSNNAQKTNVTVTVKGATFNIVGNNISNTGMYPTNDCDGAGALVGEVATMTVVNETESPMTASLKLRVSLYSTHGSLGTEKAKINWAIVDTSTSDTCETTSSYGTFSSVTVAATSSAFPNTTYTDIDTGEIFKANGTTKGGTAVTTTKTYRVYVWLDSTYSHQNEGNTIDDPMQDLKISVKWSPASTLIQSGSK